VLRRLRAPKRFWVAQQRAAAAQEAQHVLGVARQRHCKYQLIARADVLLACGAGSSYKGWRTVRDTPMHALLCVTQRERSRKEQQSEHVSLSTCRGKLVRQCTSVGSNELAERQAILLCQALQRLALIHAHRHHNWPA